MSIIRTSSFLAVALAIFGWSPLDGLQTEAEEAAEVDEAALELILQDEEVFSAEIARVVSGDTVIVDHSGKSIAVCLAGVGAPEEGQPFSREAHRHASDLLLGKAVTVRLRGLDAPARCEAIGRVLLGEEDVSEYLLRAGLAWYCDRSALPNSALPEIEAAARASERGLWSDPEPVRPWVFRGAETCLEESSR